MRHGTNLDRYQGRELRPIVTDAGTCYCAKDFTVVLHGATTNEFSRMFHRTTERSRDTTADLGIERATNPLQPARSRVSTVIRAVSAAPKKYVPQGV